MLSPGKNRLIKVTEDEFQSVRETYKATAESIEKDIEEVIQWYSTQEHLPNLPLDRGWLERLLILNKYSVERVKTRLDGIYEARAALPEYFTDRDPARLFKVGRLGMLTIPLPKLATDLTRVFINKIHLPNAEHFNFLDAARTAFLISEYRQRNDYCLGERYICDARNITMGHVFKSGLISLRRGEYVNRKAFGHRIAGIHYISKNPVLKYLLVLFRMVLPVKLSSRITLHETWDDLPDVIPRDILPEDYGGEEKPFSQLVDEWEEELCSESQDNQDNTTS